MHRALPSVTIVLALIAPSLVAAGQVPQPDLETPLAAPSEATGQALQAALEATDGLLNPAFAVAAAELAAFQAEVLRCTAGDCDPDVLPLTQAGVDFVTASAAYAAGQAVAVADLGTIWGETAGQSFALLHAYANTTAAVAVDTSAPNDRIVVLEPQGRVAGAPVADLVGGFYRFNLTVVDRTGAPVALGDWRLEVLGLQVLPGQEPLAVPGLAALTKPVATLTLLFAAERDVLNGAVFDTSACGGQEGCAVLSVPAASLKLERLYAGSQVFVRFLPGSGGQPSDVGWHNALVAAAYQASLEEPAVPFVAEVPSQPPLPEGAPPAVRSAYAALSHLFGGSIGDDPAKRSLVAADVLDQFPTAIVLAPGVVDPASPDPDGDDWTTLVELSLNSDPFDPLSRPGVDDDADGIMNYLEASRADAVDWLQGLEPTPTPVPLTRRVPLPGLALVGNEIPAGALGAGPLPTTLLPADLASRTDVEVLDVGVAGPPEFVLQDLTFERMGALLAGADAELQNFTLVLDAPEGPRAVAEWAFRAGQWVRVDPGTLTCSPDCGPEAASWTLGLGLDVDDVARFHLFLDVGPRGVDRLTLDGKVFQAVTDAATATLTSANLPIAVREGTALGPVQTVDVRATRLVAQPIQFPAEYVAGAPVDVVFQAEDAFTNVDLGYGATSVDDVQFTFAEGTGLPSPSGEPAQPDLRVPLNLGATVGIGQVLLPQLRLYHATNPTTVLATDLTGKLLEVQAPSGVLDPEPWGPSKVALVGVPTELSADATTLDLAAQVTDWYGNPRPFENLVFSFGGLEPDQTVTADGAGLATFTLATPDANLPRKVAGFTYPIGVGAPAGNGTAQQVVAVIPGALASVVIEGNEAKPLVGPIRRAMRDDGAEPPLLVGQTVAGYQSITLFPRGHDKFGNRIDADVPSLWTASNAALAAALDELPAVQGNTMYPVTSRVGGVAGDVCAQPVAAPTVEGCVALNFTGLAPPVVTVDGCVPEVNATTGQPFEVCITIADDVLSSVGAPVVTLRHGGAPLALPSLVRVDLGSSILYQLTLDVPRNSLASYELGAEVSDWDTAPIEYVDNQNITLQPVGGDSLPVDMTFPVRDGIAPTLNYTFDAAQAILRGDTLVVRRATAVDVTATDNIPGAVATTATIRAAGSEDERVQDLTTDSRLNLADLNGVYELTLEAVDDRGLPATPIVLTLVVDEQAPTTELVVDGVSYEVQRNGQAVLVVPGGTDLTLASLDLPPGGAGVRQTFLDQGGNLVAVGPEDRLALSAGDHTLKFHSQDLLGLDGTITIVLVHRDLDGPTVTIGEPGDFVPSRTVNVAFEVHDASPLNASAVTATVGDIPVVLDLPEPIPGGLKFTGVATVPADAEYNLRILAADPAAEDSTADRDFVVDTVAPTVLVRAPAQGQLFPAARIALDFNVTDLHLPEPLAQECSVNGGAFVPCAPGNRLPIGSAADMPHGTHTLVVRARDLAGNEGPSEVVGFEVDALPPEDVVLADLAEFQVLPTFTLTASAADLHLARVEIQEFVDGAWVPVKGFTQPELARLLAAGPLTFDYTATQDEIDTHALLQFRTYAEDAVGNNATSDVQQTRVDTTIPTVALSPLGIVGGVVQVRGKATTSSGEGIESWVLEWSPDGATFELVQSGTGEVDGVLAAWDTLARTPPLNGDVQLRLRVTPAPGMAPITPAVEPVTVDNLLPEVTWTARPEYQHRRTFPLAATVTDDHPATMELQQDVAGTWTTVATATGAVLNHTFVAPDSIPELTPIRFRVLATDAAGNSNPSEEYVTQLDTAEPVAILDPLGAGELRLVRGVVSVLGQAGQPGSVLRDWRLDRTGPAGATVEVARGATPVLGALHALDTRPLADGPHTLVLTVRTTSREAVSAPLTVTVDNTLPGIVAPALATFQTTPTFSINATVTDRHLVRAELVEVVGGTRTVLASVPAAAGAAGLAFTYTARPDQELVPLAFRVVATDAAGNVGEADLSTTVDSADPVAVLQPLGVGASSLVRGAIDVAGQAGLSGQTIQGWVLQRSGATGSVEVARGTAPALGRLGGLDTTLLPDGPLSLMLTVTTVSGRTGTASLSAVVDNTRPAVSIEALPAFKAARGFAVNASAVDANLGPVSIEEQLPNGTWVARANGGAVATLAYLATEAQELVPLRFRAVAADLAGNVNITAEVTTTVDTADPVAVLHPTGLVLAEGLPRLVGGLVPVTGQAGLAGQTIQGWVLEQAPEGGAFSPLASGSTVVNGTLTAWDTTGLPDGVHTLRLTVTTVSGRSSATTLALQVDNTAPVARLVPPPEYQASRTFNLTVTADDPHLQTLELQERVGLQWVVRASFPASSPTASGTFTYTATEAQELAALHFRAVARDLVGNVHEGAMHFTSVDTALPIARLEPLGNLGFVRSTIPVLGQAGVVGQTIQGWLLEIDRGAGFVELARSTAPKVGQLVAWNTRDEADGTYALRLTTTTVGSRSETANLSVTVDNTAPVIQGLAADAAHSVPNTWSSVRATRFQYALSEPVATLECRLVEVALVPPINCNATGTEEFTTPDGRHTFRVAVTDRAGNAAAATFRLFVDSTPPAVTVESLPADIAETARLTVRAAVSDPASGVRSVLLNTTVGTQLVQTPMVLNAGVWSATVGPFPQGLVQVQVVARDALNNVQETAPKTVGIRDTTPPVVTLREPSARVHAAAIPVVLDATDAGQGVANVTVELLERPTTRVVLPFTGGLFQLTPALSVADVPNGAYNLSVRVLDRAGNAATVVRSVDVAKVPALNVPGHAAGERELTVQVVTPGGPETLALWLYPTVHGEIRGRILMNRAPGTDLWTATVHDLEPGDLVAYFVEARDGLASTRAPATGAIEAIVPIPDVATLDWSALETITERAQVENPENHEYVNILSAQFTHDGANATFGLEVEGAFPIPADLGSAPVPRYLVEFDTDEDADPEFVLRATYTGEPVPANWVGQGRPSDTDIGEPAFNFTVVPGANRTTLGFQVPVHQLVAHIAGIDEAEVRFVARGSLVTTTPKPFDVTAPNLGAPTVPAELDDATPLTLTVPVTDNRDAGDKLTAQVELRVNGDLSVVKASVVDGLVTLPASLAEPLPLGTAEVVVTTLDKSGNRNSTLPITIPVVDRTLPSLGPLGLTLNGEALAGTRAVRAGAPLVLQADLRDNAGLATAVARLDGQDLPLTVLDGTLRGTTFELAAPSLADQGRHTLDLVVTDLTGLRLPFTPVTLQVLDEVPPAITLAVVRAPGAFTPTAPALPALEPGDRAVISALVLDNLGQVAEVTAQVTQGATTCTLTLPARGGDLFEAPLDCPLGLGPVAVEVGATDGQHAAIPVPLAFTRQDSAPPTVAVTLRKPDGTLVPLQRGGSVSIRDSDAALHDLLLSIQDAGTLDRATVLLEPREQVLANIDLAPAIFSPGEFTRHLPALEAGSYRVVVTALDLVGPGTVRALADAPPFELTLVVADALEPRLAFEPGTPLGGDVTPTHRATFAGTILDASGVDPASLQFTIDGLGVSPVLTEVPKSPATAGASGYRFLVAQDLPTGRHEFSLRGADLSGFRVASTWGFYVVEKPVFAPLPAPVAPAVAAPAPAAAPPAPVTGATGAVQPLPVPPPPPAPVEAPLPALPEAGQAEVRLTGPSVVTAVAVTAEAALDQARVVARQLPAQEQAPHEFGSLHQQFELTIQDASGTVAPAVLDHIDFRVSRSDLAAAGADPAGTALLHLEPDGSWSPRATTFLAEDAEFYHYRAEHGGRSTFAIVFDRAPPVVELIAPSVASLTGALPVEAVARDDTAVKDLEVTLDGATIGSGAPLLRLLIDPTTLAQVAQGTVELVAVAKDATGKTGRAVQVVFLERGAIDTCLDPASDQQPPVTTVAWRGGDAAVFGDILGIKGPVSGRFNVVDQGPEGCRDPVVPEVRYRVDDGPWLGGLTVDLRADQPHTLEYYAVDRRGNEEAHHTLRVVPAEDADPSAPQPVEPLEAPKRGLPGFEAVALAAAALGVALLHRRRRGA